MLNKYHSPPVLVKKAARADRAGGMSSRALDASPGGHRLRAPGGGGREAGLEVKFKEIHDLDCPPQPDVWGRAVFWMRCRHCE